MSDLLLENIVKKYPGNVEVLKGIDLKINSGEFIIIIGPSGCGKSTLLRLIAGLENITDGHIYIDSQCINDCSPKDRNISMVFQNYALFPHMTVYENMEYGLKIRKENKQEIERKIFNASKILKIIPLLKRKPNELSGGEQQRVALGRAMVKEPKLFLMDEPLSNLDIKLKDQMIMELRKLHEKLKTTFIYVTHDQKEAMLMADRIVVMSNGHILQVDTPHNIYSNPKTLFVAKFIGSPEINLINSIIVKSDKDLILKIFNNNIILKRHNKINIDTDVVIGIRPEDIDVNNTDKDIIATGQITSIETLGPDNYLEIYINSKEVIVARETFNNKYNVGDKVTIGLNLDNLHIYDKITEERLL